jgi:retinol dehydrogenase-12
LAKHNPSQIFLAARSQSKADTAIAEIKNKVPNAAINFLELDLTSFMSIKKAADEVNKSTDRLDILMNNAGIMATPPGLTKEGYEVQFGTNHMGHALLTRLLLPTMQKTAKERGDVRIVNLTSMGHNWPAKGGICLEECKTDMRSTSTWGRYGQSKLANILYTKGLASHYPDIKCMAVHPGAVDTGLQRGPAESWPWVATPMKLLSKVLATTVAQGALTQLFAATNKDAKTGVYYVPIAQEDPGSSYARDENLVKELWDYTQKELDAAGY